jgi:sugar-phosphatase
MTGNIKAIIFDLDGVIIDSNPAIVRFWKNWADKESIELTDSIILEWIYGRKVGDTIQGLFNHVSNTRKKEIEESADSFDSSLQPNAVLGVSAFISQLNTLEIPVGVVTSSQHARMFTMLTYLSIQNNFTHFVTAHDVSKGKPHPEPYLTMSAKMNIPSGDCLVFEDAISGIQSAKAANMQAIGIGNELTRNDLLKYGAHDVIPDFTHLHIEQGQLITPNGIVFSL